MKITTHVGAVDAVGDAVGGAVVDDNSTCRPPNSNPMIEIDSPWLVDGDRCL